MLVARALRLVDRREDARDFPAVYDRAIAAELLGGVERVVGRAEQGLVGLAVRWEARDPEADRDRHLLARESVPEGHPQALGEHICVVIVRVGNEQRELLAADARNGVEPALAPLEDVARLPERDVAAVVAIAVVDVLEVVEVADQHAERVAAAAGPLELEVEGLLEAAAVEEPGEHIGARRAREPLDHLVDPAPEAGDQDPCNEQRAERDQPELEPMRPAGATHGPARRHRCRPRTRPRRVPRRVRRSRTRSTRPRRRRAHAPLSGFRGSRPPRRSARCRRRPPTGRRAGGSAPRRFRGRRPRRARAGPRPACRGCSPPDAAAPRRGRA